MPTMVYIAVIIAVCVLALTVVVMNSRKNNSINQCPYEELLNGILPGVENYTIVLANRTEVKKKDSREMHRSNNFSYNFYLYAFKDNRSYAFPVSFKKKSPVVSHPIELNKNTVSRVLTRYMHTNARFYDSSGNLIIEFTVPAVSTKQICVDCPFDYNQTAEAQEFFVFIERFAEHINVT